MRQRPIELGAPSGIEGRRQGAPFPDRGGGRNLVATEGTQVGPAGIAQGEKALSSPTRSDGCVFWAGSTKPTRPAIPMTPRLRPMKHGCATIAGCPKKRSEIIAPSPITSSTGWPQPIFLWLRSGSPTSTMRLRTEKARGTCGRRTIHDYAQRLRAFFRFAEARGWCMPGIAKGIMPPRFMRDEICAEGAETGGCPAPLGHHGGRPAGRQARPRDSDVVYLLRPESRRSRRLAPG